MYLAIVNNQTNLVENVIVPPIEGQLWSPQEGFIAVETEIGTIGDIWDGTEFIKPNSPELQP